MDTFAVFQQMFIFVFVIAVGFVIRRLAMIDETTNATLTKLILQVTMPATLISTIANSTLEVPLGEVFLLLGIIALTFVIMIFISFASPFVFRAAPDERGVFTAMGLLANAGFMGIPLTYAFFGPDGMFYAVLYNIVFTFVAFSLGVKFIGGTKAKLSLRFFLSPVLVAAVGALILFLLGIQLPYVLNRGIGLIGNITTPAAMILLGSILGAMPLDEVFRGWRVYAVSLVRLVISPLAVYLFLILLPLSFPPLFIKVVLVAASSPMAVIIATLAIHYDTHHELASRGIFISTLLSVVTMPLILSFLF